MAVLFESTLPALTFELTVKSLFLLTVVMAVTWFMRRTSAAVRHLYFAAASVALIVLPLAGMLLPSWQPDILPDGIESFFAPAATSNGSTSGSESSGAGRRVDTRSGGAPIGSPAAQSGAGSWHKWFFVIWLAGSLILAAGLAGGKLYGFVTARNARRVTDEDILAALNEAAQKVGLNREVAVLESNRFVVPSVTGILKPKVLIPPQVAFWPRERLRAVLQHELSHVKRNDILVQLLSQVACCIYWLNPLAWILERKIFIERERACDDAALSRDVKASDYAGFLMEVLEEMGNKRNTLWVTAAMAEGTDFKDRILSVLNPVARRTSPRKGHLAVAAAMALLLVLPLSVVRPWTAQATELAAAHTTDRRAEYKNMERLAAENLEQYLTTRDDDILKKLPLSALIKQLKSPSARMRERAAVALGESRDLKAVLPLIEALNDERPDVREHVASALGQLGDRRAVLPLCDALANDRSWVVREHAATALGYIGDERAVLPLCDALANDEEWVVREHAATALGRIGDDRAYETLLEAMETDPNYEVREHALSALRIITGGR